ncbi:transcription factor bHLH53-like [Humulus lupulus]|uniref:transcription factor bHLH53-like n=1 Tax=Humulus lupulus TaxID=3486 RepID=UPI002B409288|nr:transcription factor bHLH53-like [Humulus lupulus]
MALRFWDSSLQHLINQDVFSFPQTQIPELQEPLVAPHYFFDNFNYDFPLSDTSIDPIFEANNNHSSYYSESNNYIDVLNIPSFHYPPPQNNHVVPDDDTISSETIFPHPKRQKITYQNQCRFNSGNICSSEFSNGYFLNPPGLISIPEPIGNDNIIGQVQEGVVNSCGYKHNEFHGDEVKRQMRISCSNGGRLVLSPQSIAARERRRKISEKTEQLGMLIPGENKMSTAEMFDAAAKYVKFLQAQLAVLQLIASIQNKQEEKKGTLHLKELAVLASPSVQEKLYLEEKCLVPNEFVQTLANTPPS